MPPSSDKNEQRGDSISAAGIVDLTRFDRSSTLAVLCAASVSPVAAHRQSSISVAAAAVHRQDRDGATTATADDLTDLLAVGEQGLAYAGFDDYQPLDVRLGVSARWGNQLFRLAPGGWERPISIVEEAKLACHALDPSLDERLGFRLRDFVELALRHMDEVVRLLSGHWPHSADVRDGAPFVTPEEVGAAREAPTIDSTAARCSDPVRGARALRWASCEPGELCPEPTAQSGIFGPVLAVRRGAVYEALPAGFMLDGIYSGIQALSSLALEHHAARAAWEGACRQRVLRLIAGRGGPLATGVDAGAGRILALQPIEDGVLLAVDVAAVGLPELDLAHGEERLRAVVPGATLRTPRGALAIGEDEEVLRLLVVVGTASLAIFGGDDEPPVNVVAAEDLRWIITGADRADDLAVFLRDLQTPTSEYQYSFGTFDLWELWKANGGAFHRLGAPLTSLMVAPHHERAEWNRHAELEWLERSLLALGMPGLCAWPEVNLDDDSDSATLIDLVRDTTFHVAVRDDGVVVGVRHALRRSSHVRPANIARTVVWKLRHVDDPISLLAAADSGASVRIEVRGPLELDDATVTVSRDGAVFVVNFDDRVGEELARNSAEVERRIGRLLAAATSRSVNEQHAFVSAWDNAPAGIAVDSISLPQRAHNLSPFVEPHGSFRAKIERTAAQRLMAAGVSPGLRRAQDARDLESRQIHPVLMDLFREAVAPFDNDAVLRAVLEDLERIYLGRWRDDGHHARLASLATTPTGLRQRVVDNRQDSTVAVRSLSLAVEEILRSPPKGDRVPQYFDLQAIYAAAYLLFDSGMRSETIHQAVSGTELEITDGFELITRSTDIAFDFSAFNAAQAAATFPERPMSNETDENEAGEDWPRSILRALPDLNVVDAAIRTALGFGLDALLGVLDTIVAWPVTDQNPITIVALTALLDNAVNETGYPRDELEAAADWLTLRGRDLRVTTLEHWELDRRAVRLANRPLVEQPDEQVILCPWGTSATRKIVGNHLLDGRLPWPQSALPHNVNQALQTYRSRRNKDLERDVITALTGRPHLKTRGSIKKAKVLGLPVLPRELDGICIDEARSRIWVIEVKDRTVAFSPHQLRTAIDEFHEENGYIAKVCGNVAIIQDGTSSVASALGAANPERSWDVVGLMVTRRIEPAAYVGNPPIIFCTANTVTETIDTGMLPHSQYAAAVG